MGSLPGKVAVVTGASQPLIRGRNILDRNAGEVRGRTQHLEQQPSHVREVIAVAGIRRSRVPRSSLRSRPASQRLTRIFAAVLHLPHAKSNSVRPQESACSSDRLRQNWPRASLICRGTSFRSRRTGCTDDVRLLVLVVKVGAMASAGTRSDRIELRTTQEEKRLIADAAAREHLDVTRFIMRNVLPVARDIVRRSERIFLSERDSKRVLELLERPPKPTEALIAAARRRAKV